MSEKLAANPGLAPRALLYGTLTPPSQGWQLGRPVSDSDHASPVHLQVPHPTESADRDVGLPRDLLDQALRRLVYLAALMGSLMFVSVGGNVLLDLLGSPFPLPPISVASRGLAVVAAVALIWIVRRTDLDRRRKLDIGLGFEVIGAAAVCFTEIVLLREFGYPLGVVSTVSLWIVVFQLIVPTTPVRALVAATASAATVPLTLGVIAHTQYPAVDSELAFGLYKTTFGAALVAWLASRVMYRMGTAVSQARRMGSYKLEKKLGTGGMGEVWQASHAMLKRPAAIKLIKPERVRETDDEARRVMFKRFEREAQTTANFKSVHTVNLFDFGTTEDGTFYYVMELLDGLDLDTLVKRHGPLAPERVAHILRQVCHSLVEAHRSHVIHRDLKPANIFLCRLGPDYDFVKVLDFGLVKEIDAGEGDAKLTMDGVTTGTPAFMAPEVALGKGGVNAATDVYMIGCVAYWLLTGELVFVGDSPVSLIAQHVREPPPPLRDRTEMPIPAPLESLIMACLAKDPEERPRDAEELLTMLEECPLDGHPAWTNERARQWWETHLPTATRSA